MKNNKKFGRIALVVALLVVVCVASIAGTVAWLQDKTGTVTNTFAPTDISITLTEEGATGSGTVATKSFELIPGQVYSKEPVVTVEAGSEDCWLFVEMIEEGNPSSYINYAFNVGAGETAWKLLNVDGSKVYYREVLENTVNQTWYLLTNAANEAEMANGSVKIKESVTVDTMPEAAPTISFKAYAIQKANIAATAEKSVELVAWELASLTNPPNFSPKRDEE